MLAAIDEYYSSTPTENEDNQTEFPLNEYGNFQNLKEKKSME